MAARRPAHKVAHGLNCPNGVFSWADCDRLSAKPCSAMLESRPEECSKRAVAEYEGKGYCGVHYSSRVEGGLRAKRIAIARASLDERITAHLDWIATHPSVWSPREESNPVTILTTGGQPRVRGLGGGDGESNPVSSEVPVPGTEAVSAGSGGPTAPRTPVVWSAASGLPPKR